MQKDVVESLQSDRESLEEKLSLLIIGRDRSDFVAQIVYELHSRCIDWALSFQSNRLEHVRPRQRGVLGLFSGRRHLSYCAS